MTAREAEIARIYRREMRKCDRMELIGLALMVLGPVIGMTTIAASFAAMCQ